MSAGLLPVSLGMALTMLVAALFRRIRASFALAAPFNETGYERPAPEDFAVADTVVVLAIVLVLFGGAYCVRKLLKLRAELKALESEDDR